MAITTTSSTNTSATTLSSPGIGSGLDVTGLVSKLMSVESLPLTALNNKQASFQASLTAYGSLQGVLSSLQTTAQAMATPANFSPIKASVADASIFSATADSTASTGSYNIEVDTLAQAQKLRSATGVSSSAQFAAGTLTLDFGTYGASSFTPDTSRSTSITIDSNNNTLQGIRDAINGANAGVTASIVNDGTASGNRLVIASNTTGLANAVRISVNQTGTTPSGGANLTSLSYDASGVGLSGMTQTTAAADATLKVDGMSVTSSSNVVSGAIQGVTLNLSKVTGSNVTTALTLSKDTTTVQSAIQNFVKAYNAVNTQLKTSTAYDSSTGKGAALNGDATARTIQAELRNVFNKAIAGAPSGSSTLADIGITFQKDGSLAINSSKLTTALANPNVDVSKIFAATSSGSTKLSGYGTQLDNLIGSMLGSGGLLAGRQAGINSSISAIGKQRDAMNIRLTAIQKNYLAQFNSLDKMIASMNTTSSYLTQQLAQIAANSKSA